MQVDSSNGRLPVPVLNFPDGSLSSAATEHGTSTVSPATGVGAGPGPAAGGVSSMGPGAQVGVGSGGVAGPSKVLKRDRDHDDDGHMEDTPTDGDGGESSTGGGLDVPGNKTTQPFSRSPELRISHKIAERKRRKEMKDLFDELGKEVPAERGAKASKWEILSKTIDFISFMKTKNADLQRQVDALKRELATARGLGGYPTPSFTHYPAQAQPVSVPVLDVTSNNATGETTMANDTGNGSGSSTAAAGEDGVAYPTTATVGYPATTGALSAAIQSHHQPQPHFDSQADGSNQTSGMGAAGGGSGGKGKGVDTQLAGGTS